MRALSFEKLNRDIRRAKRGGDRFEYPVVQTRAGYEIMHPTKGRRRVSEKRLMLRTPLVDIDAATVANAAARRAWNMHQMVEAIRSGIRQQQNFGSRGEEASS